MDDFRVLILDDEVDILESLSNILGASGYEVDIYRTAKDFLNERAWKNPGSGAALVDLSSQELRGSMFYENERREARFPNSCHLRYRRDTRCGPGIAVGGPRVFRETAGSHVDSRMARLDSLHGRNGDRASFLADTLARYELVGSSPAMSAVRATIVEYAPLAETVLICGETGTGKELAAAQLHYLSPRRSRPFRAVNIAALASELIDSQLFGHLKGSFSGAIDNNQGLVLASKK